MPRPNSCSTGHPEVKENHENLPQNSSPSISSYDDPVSEYIVQGFFSPPKHPGTLASAGDYSVVALVGRGGMGEVYQARDNKTGETVAIKFIRPDGARNQSVLARFVREAKHLQKLKHPNIVPVLEILAPDGAPKLVMPYYVAGSLARMLKPGQRMDGPMALKIATQLAEALEYVHNKGLAHRDVKPGNILIEGPDRVRLSDFGLAQSLYNDALIDPDQARPEGSAPYMSPQVAMGMAEDTRCDIYAFGAVLYEMLCGRRPYEGTKDEILDKIKAGPPVAVLKVNPQAHKGLALVAEGAMARDHRRRYANMSDVLADLRAIENGRKPCGPAGRTGWSTPAGILRIAAACALAGLIALGFWMLRPPPKFEVTSTLDFPPDAPRTTPVFAHWDGDRIADLCLTDGRTPRIWLATGEEDQVNMDTVAGKERFDVFPLAGKDLDSDGLDEIFVSWKDTNYVHVAAMNKNGWPLVHGRFPQSLYVHPQYSNSWAHAGSVHLAELNGDNSPELLVTVGMAWGSNDSTTRWPRGVLCFDTRSANLNWFFEIAPFLDTLLVSDLDRDGTPEIILGSQAPSNGKELSDGTDDSHSYLYALNANGSLRWRRELGPYFSVAKPLGVLTNAQGNAELYALLRCDFQFHNRGDVVKLDRHGEILARYALQTEIIVCAIAPRAEGEPARLIACDATGDLHLLDEQLNLLLKSNVTPNPYMKVQMDITGFVYSGGDLQVLLKSTQIENHRRGQIVVGKDRSQVQNFVFHNSELVLVDARLLQVRERFLVSPRSSKGSFTASLAPSAPNEPARVFVVTEKARFMNINGTTAVMP